MSGQRVSVVIAAYNAGPYVPATVATSGVRRLRLLGAHETRCEAESDRELVSLAIERHSREIVEAVSLMSTIGGPQQ